MSSCMGPKCPCPDLQGSGYKRWLWAVSPANCCFQWWQLSETGSSRMWHSPCPCFPFSGPPCGWVSPLEWCPVSLGHLGDAPCRRLSKVGSVPRLHVPQYRWDAHSGQKWLCSTLTLRGKNVCRGEEWAFTSSSRSIKLEFRESRM